MMVASPATPIAVVPKSRRTESPLCQYTLPEHWSACRRSMHQTNNNQIQRSSGLHTMMSMGALSNDPRGYCEPNWADQDARNPVVMTESSS